MHSARYLVAFLLISACTSVPAATYRWLDENGVIVYSQSPPPSGDAVRLKQQHTPDSETVRAAQERLRNRREQFFDEEEIRKGAEAERQKKAVDERRRAANCTAAGENLETFRNLGPRRIRTPDGRVLRLSEEEVEMEIEKAQGQVDIYCK